MENFELQEYRDDLAQKIMQEPDKENSRVILNQAKATEEYQEARKLKLDSAEDLTSEVTTTRQATEELKSLQVERQEYSIEDAEQEKPLMHYSKAGNIFQILRFGIQSNNFKNRFDVLREDNPKAEKIAQQMCGLRIKQGGSYQGADSISLLKYSEELFIPPSCVLYLINPNIKTFGDNNKERDLTAGYGQGIKKRMVAGDYEVGNNMAYNREILGANIIVPKELRAVVVNKFTSIISDMREVVRQNVKIFMTETKRTPRDSEDLVATLKLLAEITSSEDINTEIQALRERLATMSYHEICTELNSFQRKALAEFVGTGKKLNEENLRRAIENKFNIHFIQKITA